MSIFQSFFIARICSHLRNESHLNMRYINGINLIINKGFSTEIGIYLICTKFSFNDFFFIEYADNLRNESHLNMRYINGINLIIIMGFQLKLVSSDSDLCQIFI